MVSIEQLHLIYKILKMTGGAGAGIGVIVGGIKWLTYVARKMNSVAESLGSIPEMSKNVQTIMTNHLPHIQMEVGEAREQFQTLRGDIKGISDNVAELDKTVATLSVKQETTSQGLHTLGQMFVAHLDKSRES
jgi:hypothetical protein